MQAVFTDEQNDLKLAVRDLARGGLESARAVFNGGRLPAEPSAALRRGFSGLGIPESDGGMGGGLVECAIVAEQLGRQLVPSPYLSHLLAVQVAHASGLDVEPAVNGGEMWALAVEESGQTFANWKTDFDGDTLHGRKSVVRDAGTADAMVVAIAGDRVALASADEVNSQSSMDPTRPMADVRFSSPVIQEGQGAAESLARTYPIVAAALVGAGQGALELAASYVQVREQFGQPVGRFQGIAHQLADARSRIEIAWSLTLYACWALDAGNKEAMAVSHAARAKAGEAAVYASERGVQAHGGIGITADADPHLFLRRVMADSRWVGSTRVHRLLAGRHAFSLLRS